MSVWGKYPTCQFFFVQSQPYYFSLSANVTDCVVKYGQCGQHDVFSVSMEAFDHATQFWCFEERAGRPKLTSSLLSTMNGNYIHSAVNYHPFHTN